MVPTHHSRATIEHLDLTLNLAGQTLNAIKRLPAADAPATASKKSNVGL